MKKLRFKMTQNTVLAKRLLLTIIVVLYFSSFIIDKNHTPLKKHPIFDQIWVGVPVDESIYFETINAKNRPSKHFISFQLNPSEEEQIVDVRIEILNLSKNKVLSSSPTTKIKLSPIHQTVRSFWIDLPATYNHGFYYLKVYINDEFVTYKDYIGCSGKLIAYK